MVDNDFKSQSMTWIFDTCTDEYGSCIRQYVMFGVSLIVLLLALYSCVSILRQQNKRLSFELLPIAVNTATSIVVFAIYTQMEIFNIRIALLVVEVYSYFILTYGFVYMVFKQNPILRGRLRLMKRILFVVSVLAVGSIVMVIVLSIYDVIRCSEDQGAGSIALIVLEIPLCVVIWIYSHKSKDIIRHGSAYHSPKMTEYTHKTQHLLNGEDQYKKIKLVQLNLVRFAFAVSFVLHGIQLFCYFYGDEEIICSRDTNKITVTSSLELYILIVQNISELFPHFIIPFIFWYLPATLTKQSVTVYMTSEHEDFQSRDDSHHAPRLRMNRTESRLVNDVKSEEEIRQKLNSRSPLRENERHINRIPTF